MRVGLAGLLIVGVLAVGCNDVTHPTSLVITPGGTIPVTGPTSFQAVAMNTGAPISWTVTGGGTLSGTTGEWVVYRPPPDSTTNLTATLTATSGALTATATLHVSPPVTRLPGLGADVDVRYDRWEIPHVTCAHAADCFRAQGYLHARDRLFQMDFLRRVATGRLAEMVGPLGLSQDVQLRTLFLTRSGEALGKALARNIEAGTREKVQAYVDGINAWLAQLRASGAPLPAEYAQLPYHLGAADVPDWTLADVASFMRLQQYSLSSTLDEEIANGRFVTAYPPVTPANIGKLGVWLRSGQVSSETSYTLQPAAAPRPIDALVAKGGRMALRVPDLSGWAGQLDALAGSLQGLRFGLKPLDGSTGSNNWVVSAAKSATGKAMVANDPHLSLQYPPNFHLSALTSTDPADHLDVTGGAFPGTPGAQVGRGKNVGWGVTVVGYDVTDIYQEQFLPPFGTAGAPLTCAQGVSYCVLFKGAPVNAVQVPLGFQVRTAGGLVDAQTLPPAQRPPPGALVVPHHGPIIQAPDPVTGRGFSVRWTGHEEATQDLSAFLGLNTATDVDAAMTALKKYATGAQNFVMADDAGHIAYSPHALVPHRMPWAASAPPWFPLPGDGTAEWGTGVAGDNCAGSGSNLANLPKPACWIADADLPQGKDPAEGFYATANADPLGITAGSPPLPLDSHGNYLAFAWTDATGFRHARITERLQSLATVSQADMESIQADHASRFGAAFYRSIAAMAAGDATFEAARGLLAAWKDGGYDCPTGLSGTDPAGSAAVTTDPVLTDSAACHLFHVFVRGLLPAVFADDLALAGLGVDGVNALKGMLHMLENPTTADQAFCSTVDATGVVVAATTCEAQVRTALANAYARLSGQHGAPAGGGWAWGRVHTFQPVSQFPLVTLGFEPGPFARPGGAFTVDVANPSLTGSGSGFPFTSSANVRHVSVMDPAAPVVRMQLPGPEVSEPYGIMAGPDLLGDWTTNTYFDYATSAQVSGATVASQRFTP